MPDASTSTMTPPNLGLPHTPYTNGYALPPSRIPKPIARDAYVGRVHAETNGGPYARPQQHTVHINIGRIDVPRSLPAMRTTATQTDETSVAALQQEARDKALAEAVEAKRFKNRLKSFGVKYVWPALLFLGQAAVFCLGRVGIGFRGN